MFHHSSSNSLTCHHLSSCAYSPTVVTLSRLTYPCFTYLLHRSTSIIRRRDCRSSAARYGITFIALYGYTTAYLVKHFLSGGDKIISPYCAYCTLFKSTSHHLHNHLSLAQSRTWQGGVLSWYTPHRRIVIQLFMSVTDS